ALHAEQRGDPLRRHGAHDRREVDRVQDLADVALGVLRRELRPRALALAAARVLAVLELAQLRAGRQLAVVAVVDPGGHEGALAAGGQGKDHVVITGSVDVPHGSTAKTIVIVDGPVRIDGHVTGDVVAIHGTVTVAGRVDGDLTTVSKRARLLAGARVRHDV